MFRNCANQLGSSWVADSPARGDSILYRPDSGYSDGRGSSRMSDRDSHRDRSPMLSDYGRSSFEAIADFPEDKEEEEAEMTAMTEIPMRLMFQMTPLKLFLTREE